MWRTIKVTFTFGLLAVGIYLGAQFMVANSAEVNVVFPYTGRESGLVTLGKAVLAATGAGVGLGLIVALFTSFGMTLYATRLKRQIRALRKEIDSLRNLPILEEELDRSSDDDEDDDVLSTSRSIDFPPGPVRGGSTVAPIGGDDDEDERGMVNIDRPEDETRLSTGSYRPGGTRKIDIP